MNIGHCGRWNCGRSGELMPKNGNNAKRQQRTINKCAREKIKKGEMN
jgi:hypothetical protein